MTLRGLDARLVDSLHRAGVTALFPVQEAVVPAVLAQRDVLVRSPTGSGKTLAYAIPIAQTLLDAPPPPPPPCWRLRALVVVPTRDVAAQVAAVFAQLFTGALGHLRAASAVGGGADELGLSDADALEAVDVLVATPGRLLELLGANNSVPGRSSTGEQAQARASLEHLRFLVVDEADRLLGSNQGTQEWIPVVLRLAHSSVAGLAARPEADGVHTNRLPHPADTQRARLVQPALFPLFASDVAAAGGVGAGFGSAAAAEEREGGCCAPFFVQESPRLQRMLFSATLVESTRRLLGLHVVNPYRYDSAVIPTAASLAERAGAAADDSDDDLPMGADALVGGVALQEHGEPAGGARREDEAEEAKELEALGELVSTRDEGLEEKAYVVPETLVQHAVVYGTALSREGWLAAALVRMGLLGDPSKQLLCFASAISTAHTVALFLSKLFAAYDEQQQQQQQEAATAGEEKEQEEQEDATSKKKEERKRRQHAVAEYSSDLAKHERERTLKRFRKKRLQVLVTTDVLARGIDLPGVDFVLNLDCPRHVRTYVHRAGRTARAGCVGHVYTMLAPHELPVLRSMLRDAGVAEALRTESFAKSDLAQARALCPSAAAPVQKEQQEQEQREEEQEKKEGDEARQPDAKRRRTRSGSAAGVVSKDTFHTTATMKQKQREEHLRQKRHEERAQQRKELKIKQQKEQQRREKRRERRRKWKLLKKQQKEQEGNQEEHQEEEQQEEQEEQEQD